MASEPTALDGGIYPRGFSRDATWPWPLVKAREIVSLNYGRALRDGDRRPGTVPVYGTNGRCGWNDKPLFAGPTVILGRKGQGPLGVEWCDSGCWVIDTAYYVTPKTDNIDLRYFYYLVKYIGLNHLKDGTSNPGLSRSTFDDLLLPLPPIETQRAIAGVLSTLDDKIDSNRRTIQALEAMARAVFNAWFIDFEPVRTKSIGATSFRGMPQDVFAKLPNQLAENALGLVPAGWKMTAISDIAEFVNGKAFTNYAAGEGRMIVRIAELNSGPGASTKYSQVDAEPQYTAYPDDILFAWSGSLGVYRWHRGEAIINQHIFKVIPNDRPKWYVYYRLVQAMPFFQGIASTKVTTMGHIKRSHLSEAVFVEPPKWLIDAAERLVRPCFDLVHSNERQSLNLSAIREALLPRLVAGELRASWREHA